MIAICMRGENEKEIFEERDKRWYREIMKVFKV